MRESERLTAVFVSRHTVAGRYHDGDGLYLQISQWGTKAWVLRYMLNGKSRMMGLGSVKDFSLKEARERARAQRQLLRADKRQDPLEVRRRANDEARLEAAKAVTFKAAADAYIKAHAPGWKNPKHADQWRNTLATYAFPHFGELPVASIDVGLVLAALEPIWTTKTETASRVRGRIESVLDWATVRGYRKGDNPARWRGNLRSLLPAKSKVSKVRHMPALPWQELPELMAELRGNAAISARATEFIILTATRTGEAINGRWAEVNLNEKVWTIPAERTKTGKEHRVPLSDRAIEILGSLPREHGNPFLFPGARAGKPLSDMAALQLLRGMRPDIKITTHGMRSSFRDWAAEAGYPREVAETSLGHALENKVEAAYRRSDLLERRRALMQAWAAFCAKPASSGEVIPMRRKKV